MLLKKTLQKYLKSSDQDPDYVLDVLINLENMELLPSMIKDSKIGNIVANIRETFAGSSDNAKCLEITKKAKDILLKWKKIIEMSEKSDKNISHQTIISSLTKSQVNYTKDDVETKWIPCNYNSNGFSSNATRQKIANQFIEIFSQDKITPEVARSIGLQIEGNLCDMFPFDIDKKIYATKARTLAFNIRGNNDLRRDVISKIVNIDQLLRMSMNELANSDTIASRQKLLDANIDSKRSDWYEEHRIEILKTNSIDPNNAWSFDENDDTSSEPDAAD